MLHTTRSAVDLAKSVFEIVVSDQPGKVVERHRLPRATFLEFFVNRPTATVVMEACGSAHFWARKIESLGHRAVLLPPAQVRPLFDGKRPVAGAGRHKTPVAPAVEIKRLAHKDPETRGQTRPNVTPDSLRLPAPCLPPMTASAARHRPLT